MTNEIATIQARIQYHQSCITFWQGVLLSEPKEREFMICGSMPNINELNKMSKDEFKSYCIDTMKIHLNHIQKCVNNLEVLEMKTAEFQRQHL